MRISVCALCDRATVREGLLHILGAGASRLGRPILPGAMEIDLALLLTPEQIDEVVGNHRVAVSVSSSDGAEVAHVDLIFEVDALDEVPDPLPSLPFSVPLRNVVLSTYGYYTLRVDYDGDLLQEIRFVVEKQLAVGVTTTLDDRLQA